MTSLCNALKKNVHMSSTLTYFDISHNKLDSEGSGSLSSFLASNNCLRTFLLSNVNANCEVITGNLLESSNKQSLLFLGAILRGCKELIHLDLSFNKFAKKESFNISQFLQVCIKFLR